MGVEQPKVSVIWNSWAKLCDDYSKDYFLRLAGGNEKFAMRMEQVSADTNESFRVAAEMWSEWKEFVLKTMLDYEKSWANIISPHWYRWSYYSKRNEFRNKRCIWVLSDLTWELIDRKKEETDILVNFWSQWEYSKPLKLSVAEAKKNIRYCLESIKSHKDWILWIHAEATNSINEAVALSHLCREFDMRIFVTFIGFSHKDYWLVINDPNYWVLSHIEAGKILKELDWWYVSWLWNNCWDDYKWYLKFDELILNEEIWKDFIISYPNDAEKIIWKIDHWCWIECWKVSNWKKAAQRVRNNPNLEIIWNCCWSTPNKTSEFVNELHQEWIQTWKFVLK